MPEESIIGARVVCCAPVAAAAHAHNAHTCARRQWDALPDLCLHRKLEL